MNLSAQAIHKILGFEHEVPLNPKQMAKELVVTFFPKNDSVNSRVQEFASRLEIALSNLGVQIIPYENTLIDVPKSLLLKRFFYAFFNNLKLLAPIIFDTEDARRHLTLEMLMQVKNGKKIKEGVTVIVVGEGETGNLAMDNMMSFSRSQVITIVDMPEHISEQSSFREHFDTAFQLFAHHMTNIVLGVGDKKWLLYNFNASHPIYPYNNENFEEILLYSLIPKIAAPLRPPKLRQFVVREHTFSITDEAHQMYVEDMVESGSVLDRTGLWPTGKSVDELAFRTEFYRWIGGVHLDHRTGMSFGFLARQMALTLPAVYTLEEAQKILGNVIPSEKDFFEIDSMLYVVIKISDGSYVVPVPNVYLITQRSGADKMHMDPAEDTVKIGLEQGKMIIETPKNVVLRSNYKPSYDTYVMLAHAVGAAIFGSVLKHIRPKSVFVNMLEEYGMALSHWHGYINDTYIPEGWHVYGADNPPVSCSSWQSAIYAFQGKENAFHHSMESETEYKGDIHVEPQHGTNITFRTLKELGEFLTSNQDISALGNKYLKSSHENNFDN